MMNKKLFSAPYVFLAKAEPNDGGGGSAIGDMDALKPVPMSFDEWMQSRFVGEFDQVDGVGFEDYAKWWASNKFNVDTWTQFNPDVSLDDTLMS